MMMPGSFAAACAGIRRCVARGLSVDVLTILTRQTAPRLNAIAKLASELGTARLGVLRLYPLGRAKRIWAEMALSLNEQMVAIRELQPPSGLTVMQSWHPNDRNCCWQAAAVDAFGRVNQILERDAEDPGHATDALGQGNDPRSAQLQPISKINPTGLPMQVLNCA
jgi:hypothetical protein